MNSLPRPSGCLCVRRRRPGLIDRIARLLRPRVERAPSMTQLLMPPAGHRVTLTSPRLLRSPLVLRTNANPSHADALRDLRAMFEARTGSRYLPRRGDTITHEVTV